MGIITKDITLDSSIDYITDWKNPDGGFIADQYFLHGKVILNKQVTGCGLTTYCLCNSTNFILVSPRIRLIQNKVEQFNRRDPNSCFYFNRELDLRGRAPKIPLDKLEIELQRYITNRNQWGFPLKILVTYDSFEKLIEVLRDVGIEPDLVFNIAVDESHSLIKDVKLKEYNNNCTLSRFLSSVFQFTNVLFISATPIIGYIQAISEFKSADMIYYNLIWSRAFEVITKQDKCSSPTNAFDKIWKHWTTHTDPSGNNCFDSIFFRDGSSAYSYEAVIFLNSILDIKRILRKYVTKLALIQPGDVTIICADTKENRATLKKTNPGLTIAKSIPKETDPHTTWTFVTRTAFEGVDFYSQTASTYIIANYKVESLSLDIASDIPQIIGRQRLGQNFFRHVVNIFYTDNINVIDEEAFEESQRKKAEYSQAQIEIWNSAPDNYKDIALQNIAVQIELDPNKLYLKTVNGIPEWNDLIIISEQYCRDILAKHQSWFIIRSPQILSQKMDPIVLNLKSELENSKTPRKGVEKVKLIYEAFIEHPDLIPDIYDMLWRSGFNNEASLFNSLPLNRIKACGYDPWSLRGEAKLQSDIIASKVKGLFSKGKFYSRADIKKKFQALFDSEGIRKTAKSTLITNFFETQVVKRGGVNGYYIVE